MLSETTMKSTLGTMINDRRSLTYFASGAFIVVLLLGTAAGIILSIILDITSNNVPHSQYTSPTSRINDLEVRLKELSEELIMSQAATKEANAKLTQANQNNETILKNLVDSQTSLALTELTLTEASSGLGNSEFNQVDLHDNLDSMENHRLLLVEIRKTPPLQKNEATLYWKSVKYIAAVTNASLVSSADKIMISIDNYFDWKDRNPSADANTNELAYWIDDYELSGASTYDIAIEAFREEALLSVISHLDSMSEYLAPY